MNKYRTCDVSHLGIIECNKKTMRLAYTCIASYIHNESVNSINLMAKKHRDEAKNSPLQWSYVWQCDVILTTCTGPGHSEIHICHKRLWSDEQHKIHAWQSRLASIPAPQIRTEGGTVLQDPEQRGWYCSTTQQTTLGDWTQVHGSSAQDKFTPLLIFFINF